MNKACLIGRITKEIELRYTPNNVPCVGFTLAVDRGFKDQNGESITDFINCVAWRQQAEFLSKYVKKGYRLAVEGSIQVRTYQNNQGQTIYVTEVVCDRVENLQPKEQPQQQPNGYYQQPQQSTWEQPQQSNWQQPQPTRQPRYEQQQIPTYKENNGVVDEDEDLPF